MVLCALSLDAESGSWHAAVGPSIAADVRQADRPGMKQPESKLDVLVRAHGVSRDVAERHLMACDAKIGDAHKMLQASRVQLLTSDWSPHCKQCVIPIKDW